jgi:hypothetical protein
MRHVAGRCACAANAQQGIDAQVGTFWRLRSELHPGGHGTLPGSFGVWGQRAGSTQASHLQLEAAILQVDRRLQSIASVVARTAGNPDGTGVGGECTG